MRQNSLLSFLSQYIKLLQTFFLQTLLNSKDFSTHYFLGFPQPSIGNPVIIARPAFPLSNNVIRPTLHSLYSKLTRYNTLNIFYRILTQWNQCIKSICGICGTQLTFDFRKLFVILICASRNLQFRILLLFYYQIKIWYICAQIGFYFPQIVHDFFLRIAQ